MGNDDAIQRVLFGNDMVPIAEKGWTLARIEQCYIQDVLAMVGGHRGRAAEILGIDRRTLYRKLKEYQQA